MDNLLCGQISEIPEVYGAANVRVRNDLVNHRLEGFELLERSSQVLKPIVNAVLQKRDSNVSLTRNAVDRLRAGRVPRCQNLIYRQARWCQ